MKIESTFRRAVRRVARWTLLLTVWTLTLSGLSGILILLGMFLFPLIPFMILPFALTVPVAHLVDRKEALQSSAPMPSSARSETNPTGTALTSAAMR